MSEIEIGMISPIVRFDQGVSSASLWVGLGEYDDINLFD